MRSALLAIVFASIGVAPATAGKRDDQVNGDRAALAGDETWIYNDLDKAFEVAESSGKPLFVVYRCIP